MEQNNNRTLLTLAKDAIFVVVGCFLIVRTGFFGKVIGALAVIWYGRDLWYRGKAYFLGPDTGRDTIKRTSSANKQQEPRKEDAPIIDDGKIQVTDLSKAKEVDFEKE